jgi:hypothetical protein
MRIKSLWLRVSSLLVLAACLVPMSAIAKPMWRDASATLPAKEAPGNSMNATPIDVDGDGDLESDS